MLLLLCTFVAVTLCVLITRCPAQQTKTVPSLLLPGRVYSYGWAMLITASACGFRLCSVHPALRRNLKHVYAGSR